MKKSKLINAGAFIILIALVVVFFMLGRTYAKAQNVVRKNNTFVQQSKKKTAEEPIATGYIYIDADGVQYPIYKSSKGKCFIIKTSKKTGKQYKMYLPAVTKELQQQK